MTKRDLILRDYQIPAAEHALQSPKCVLAIAPSGGKNRNFNIRHTRVLNSKPYC